MTQQAVERFATLAGKLGLTRRDQHTFYGIYRDYPVAVSMFGEGETRGLLFQFRHTQEQASLPKDDGYEWERDLEELVTSGRAAVSVEDRIAWLTLYDMQSVGQQVGVVPLLDGYLDSLSSAGITGAGKLCHYCLTNTVDSPTFDEGRVGLICRACLLDRTATRAGELEGSAAGLSASVLLAGVGAAVGGVLWAGAWIAHDWIIEVVSRGKDVIGVPTTVEIVWLVVVGVLVGGPVGYVIGRVPGHGVRWAGSVGIVGGIAAVGIGEVLFSTWLIYRVRGEASVKAGLEVLPMYWRAAPVIYLIVKSCAALLSIYFAYRLARPKRTSLAL